jgi:site-specific DNA-methyltransferase (adenine-specific)
MKNTLYYGDNLQVMREHLKNESVDLIYLDPPFNSKRDYNVLFKAPDGHGIDAQLTAFEDSWHWGPQAEAEFQELMQQPNTRLAELMNALRGFLKENDMLAYLTMMANRLVELHRVLKDTGSLYLHCDPTASHYLKLVLDAVFGQKSYRNELIWKRGKGVSNTKTKQFPRNHDVIFFYTKTENNFYIRQFKEYSDVTLKAFRFDDNDGRGKYRLQELRDYSDASRAQFKLENKIALSSSGREYLKQYLTDKPGVSIDSVWDDVKAIEGNSAESLGYPTQKPLALLERIIEASSNPGDVVLDPFCGCGTATHAAQKLDRKWIGIDITHLAVSLIEKRLKDAFTGIAFDVVGTPQDFASAQDLALRDKYQFQWWACSLVGAQPYGGKKKGADGGTDGLIFFTDEPSKPAKKAIVSVKGGQNVQRNMLADLKNTVEREKAQLGIFVTLVPPTREMVKEAAAAGFYTSPINGQNVAKIQILTIDGLLSGRERVNILDMAYGGLNFKKAAKESKTENQGSLL